MKKPKWPDFRKPEERPRTRTTAAARDKLRKARSGVDIDAIHYKRGLVEPKK